MKIITKSEEKNSTFSRRRGFTLIEIIAVISILVVILGFAIGVGYRFYMTHVLISERDDVVNLLRSARNLAMDNYDQASHGVYFDASQYTIFEGDSYAARSQDYDQFFPKSSLVSFSGPAEVAFTAVNGFSSASGTIIMTDSMGSLSATINYEGRIDW